MEKKFTSSTRKKDYIAHLAIILFAVILVLELLLVTWLPAQLSSEKLWDRQVALQEMVDLEDFLRRYIRGDVKYKNSWEEGEGFMGLSSLDVLAKYIRSHKESLTREQIQEVYSTLQQFERHYNNWNNGKFYITFEDIRIEPVLDKQINEFKEWEAKNKNTDYDYPGK